MKAIITFLAIVMSLTGYTQTVSTFLNSPTANVNDALAFDSKGNLYGSDFIGTSVYKITPSGNATVFVTGLQNPNGLAFDSHDNLYVCEYSGSAIRKYNKNGVLLNTYPVNGPPSGLIRAHGGNNMIFTIADFGNPANNSLNELTSNGTITTIYQGAPLNIPVGLTYGPGGDLYVGNYLDRTIYRLQKHSNLLEYIATVPDAGTSAPYLAFIAYSKGSLYGTNYGENKIYKINPNASNDVEIYAGSTPGNLDGDISVATFRYPSGIVATKNGKDLYISEYTLAGNIRKISGVKNHGNDDLQDNTADAESSRGNLSAESENSELAVSKFKLAAKVNPNPVSNSLNIQPDKAILSVKVHSLNGTMLKQFTKVKTGTGLDVSELKAGLYLITIKTAEGLVTQKFVKN